MADEKEKESPETPEAAEGKKKSGIVPVILGATLVIAGAAGVVVVTAPPGPPPEEQEIDFDTLEARQWDEPITVTFNPRSGNNLCRLGFYFEYKALPDPMLEEQVIPLRLKKAISHILIFLKGLTKEDMEGSEGAEHIRMKIRSLMDDQLFPEGKGKVSDIFISDLLFS